MLTYNFSETSLTVTWDSEIEIDIVSDKQWYRNMIWLTFMIRISEFNVCHPERIRTQHKEIHTTGRNQTNQ
jgi:hypothetical protein